MWQLFETDPTWESVWRGKRGEGHTSSIKGWINNKVELEKDRSIWWLKILDMKGGKWRKGGREVKMQRWFSEERAREREEKRAKEKKFAVKGEKSERGMSISQHWVVRTSTGIAILFKVHSRSLPDQLFLYIYHQVVMVLFQAVTIIFSLMAITLVVLLSTLGKCQQQTQFNTGTNRCYCDAFAFTSQWWKFL